ncbi:hypothetical protein [Nostoc sp. GT001]|uniref:TubC N-terminal docking domain-related protein n=1 Tax=Nostoc sp. GT001 TaxID=3056647 RepID=UPI0025AB0A08|nr:hypothetical protein [Nostoc sp. GT001]MDM9582037.1 hypothetical protein [Nostoc sp. GT001]
MNLNALLAELSDRGVKLLVDGEQLRIQAPKGVITPDLRNALANNKVELIRLLHQNKIGAASIPLVPLSQTQNVLGIFPAGTPVDFGPVSCCRICS